MERERSPPVRECPAIGVLTEVAGETSWWPHVPTPDWRVMTLTGLTLPELSEFDPPIAGEGSIDPMGLAAISDRLADRLVPGFRARMLRMRFVTAMAVGATACETLGDELPLDEVTTPAIAFEWLTIEGFARRLRPPMPQGIAGIQKAQMVVRRKERLSARTYLKGPSVFGINGVYKPFAVDAGVVDGDLDPGPKCSVLVRAWERDQGFAGFIDAVPGTEGGRLRANIADQVRNALRAGRCTTKPSSSLFGQLANSLHPDQAEGQERQILRALVSDEEHDTRAELARYVDVLASDLTEAEMLTAVRPACSTSLGMIIDAVVAYEQFAALLDAVFRTLVAISHSMGARPLTPSDAQHHAIVLRCADELPGHYHQAVTSMAAIDTLAGIEDVLGDFAIPRSPTELVELVFEHHERIQSRKPPNGKRPWFEPLRGGWVVRNPYSSAAEPELGPWFVHPVRAHALKRFLEDTVP